MMRTTVVVERAQLVARTSEDGRHVYRKEGKALLVTACAEPGASVAAIALAHGVNANLLRKWITLSSARDRAYPDQRINALAVGKAAVKSPATRSTSAAQFIAVELASPPATPVINAPGTISIQLGEARIDVCGVVDREALERVIDCLRESTKAQSVRR